jgi:excisionase family DNA binding protein
VAADAEDYGPTPAAPSSSEEAPLPRYLTVPEAAALLRINTKTAYEWALTRRLPGAFRLGGRWRVCRDRLIRYVRENSVPSPGETER